MKRSRRAGRGRPRVGRGPAPPRGRTTHILVVPAIGLVHHLPVGEVERAGLASFQRRRLEVHADRRGSTLLLRAGQGLLDRRARVLVLDVARRPLRRTLLLDSRPRRRGATHPPRVLLLRRHHRPERARSLAACPDGTSSTVDARVRERAFHRASVAARRCVAGARSVDGELRLGEARRDWTAIHWYGETLPSSRRVTTRRFRPTRDFPARHLAPERSRGSPLQSNFRSCCTAVLSRPGRDHPIDGCRVRRAAGARGRAPISRTRPALTR